MSTKARILLEADNCSLAPFMELYYAQTPITIATKLRPNNQAWASLTEAPEAGTAVPLAFAPAFPDDVLVALALALANFSAPAVIVTGTIETSLGSRVVVETPGKLASLPPNDSVHTAAGAPAALEVALTFSFASIVVASSLAVAKVAGVAEV
jgi:hypothetical protein